VSIEGSPWFNIRKVIQVPSKDHLLLLTGDDHRWLKLFEVDVACQKYKVKAKLMMIGPIYDICLLGESEKVAIANSNQVDIYSIQQSPEWQFCKVRSVHGYNFSMIELKYFDVIESGILASGNDTEYSRLYDVDSGESLGMFYLGELDVCWFLEGCISLGSGKRKAVERIDFPNISLLESGYRHQTLSG